MDSQDPNGAALIAWLLSSLRYGDFVPRLTRGVIREHIGLPSEDLATSSPENRVDYSIRPRSIRVRRINLRLRRVGASKALGSFELRAAAVVTTVEGLLVRS